MSYLYLEDRENLKVVKLAGHAPPHLVKWGIRETDHRVIFSVAGVRAPERGSQYSQFDTNHNLRSRVRFEAALAAFVLREPQCVMPALQMVNAALLQYIDCQKKRESWLGEFGADSSPALYNTWFGRIDLEKPRQATDLDVAAKVIQILQSPGQYSLQQTMNVHQMFAWRTVKKFGCTDVLQPLWDRWSNQMLKESGRFTGERPRVVREEGSGGRPKEGPKRNVIGFVPEGDTQVGAFGDEEAPKESHPRAVDEWKRKTGVSEITSDSGAPVPFVAAISGSTVDLMRIAKVFGGLESESLKQYFLASVAFLTGGGHHSFHEVAEVAAMVGLTYRTGQYDSLLPNSFKQTAWYDLLIEDFPDVLFSEYWPEVDSYFTER